MGEPVAVQRPRRAVELAAVAHPRRHAYHSGGVNGGGFLKAAVVECFAHKDVRYILLSPATKPPLTSDGLLGHGDSDSGRALSGGERRFSLWRLAPALAITRRAPIESARSLDPSTVVRARDGIACTRFCGGSLRNVCD